MALWLQIVLPFLVALSVVSLFHLTAFTRIQLTEADVEDDEFSTL